LLRSARFGAILPHSAAGLRYRCLPPLFVTLPLYLRFVVLPITCWAVSLPLPFVLPFRPCHLPARCYGCLGSTVTVITVRFLFTPFLPGYLRSFPGLPGLRFVTVYVTLRSAFVRLRFGTVTVVRRFRYTGGRFPFLLPFGLPLFTAIPFVRSFVTFTLPALPFCVRYVLVYDFTTPLRSRATVLAACLDSAPAPACLPPLHCRFTTFCHLRYRLILFTFYRFTPAFLRSAVHRFCCPRSLGATVLRSTFYVLVRSLFDCLRSAFSTTFTFCLPPPPAHVAGSAGYLVFSTTCLPPTVHVYTHTHRLHRLGHFTTSPFPPPTCLPPQEDLPYLRSLPGLPRCFISFYPVLRLFVTVSLPTVRVLPFHSVVHCSRCSYCDLFRCCYILRYGRFTFCVPDYRSTFRCYLHRSTTSPLPLPFWYHRYVLRYRFLFVRCSYRSLHSISCRSFCSFVALLFLLAMHDFPGNLLLFDLVLFPDLMPYVLPAPRFRCCCYDHLLFPDSPFYDHHICSFRFYI